MQNTPPLVTWLTWSHSWDGAQRPECLGTELETKLLGGGRVFATLTKGVELIETPGLIETNWVELKHRHSRTGFWKGDPTYEYFFHHRKVYWRQTDKKEGYHMTPQQLQELWQKRKIDENSVFLQYIISTYFFPSSRFLRNIWNPPWTSITPQSYQGWEMHLVTRGWIVDG